MLLARLAMALLLLASGLSLADGRQRVVAPAQLPGLVSELSGLLDTVVNQPDGDTPARRARLAELAGEDTWTVGEQSLDVRWLRAGVRSRIPEEVVLTWDRLKAWSDSLAEATPPAPPERIKALAADILRDEAYRPVKATSWIDPWIPTIERLLDILLAPMKRRSADDGAWREWFGLAAYAVLTTALAALLVRLARRRRPVRPTGPSLLPEAVQRPSQTAEQWRTTAAACAAAEQWPAAFSACWLALLLRLDETGRLAFVPSRTNREVAASAAEAGRPEVAEAVAHLAGRADRADYAGEPVTAADAAEARAIVDRLW